MMKARNWTEEEKELLRRIWVTGVNLKFYCEDLGGRSYEQIRDYATKRLKLGPRPIKAQSIKPYAWELIEQALMHEPMNTPTIALNTGLHKSSVNLTIAKVGVGPEGKLHISSWERRSNGGAAVPVYSLGAGENSPKPAPLTQKEKRLMLKQRKASQNNPFAAMVSQASSDEIFALPGRPKRGAYKSRVISMEA